MDITENLEQVRRGRVPIYKSSGQPLVCAAKSKTFPHGHVEGYLSTFNQADAEGDIIRRGAWAKTIRERVPAGRVPLINRKHLLYGGGIPDVCGVIKEASEDERGLFIRAPFGNDGHAQAVRSKASGGSLHGMSAGFLVINAIPLDTGGFDMRELVLVEGTLTNSPVNDQALITRAKSIRNEIAGLGIDDPRLSAFLDLIDEVADYVAAKAAEWSGDAPVPAAKSETIADAPPDTEAEPEPTGADGQPGAGLTDADRMWIEAELARAELQVLQAVSR
jgi:HK97 family phage prohead protease